MPNSKERQKIFRDKRRDEGYRKLQSYVHVSNWSIVKDFIQMVEDRRIAK